MVEESTEYLKYLSYFGKNDLEKLVKIFHKEEKMGTVNILRQFLLENYFDDIRKFFDYYNYVKEIRFNYLLSALYKLFPNQIEHIEMIENSKQIILFLYENNAIDILEEIISSSKIEKGRIKDNYYLIPEIDISVSELKNKILPFIEQWNKENLWKINIKWNQNSEDSIKLFFYVEKGKTPFRQFTFRKEGTSHEAPDGLKISSSLTYPVNINSCEFVKMDNNNFRIILTFADELWFKEFLIYVFKEYKIEKTDKKYVVELTSNVKSKLDIGPNLSSAKTAIDDIKNNSKKAINNSSLPKTRQKEINKIIDSINYSSPRLKNEIRSGIDELTWLANFDKCDKIIHYSKRVIQEILDKIPESRDSFFLIIGEKKKPILFEKGEIVRKAILTQDEEIGLKVFLGGEDAIKELS